MSERVALLGGTFDPIHNGHIEVFRQVMGRLGFAQGWLLVAGDPQLRDAAVAGSEARLEMAQAVAADEGWQVCDLETRHQGPTYTVATLSQLRDLHPDLEFSFVVGADAARQIQRWHDWEKLVTTTKFVITNRTNVPELTAEEARDLGFVQAQLIHVDSPPISATAIRQAVAAERGIEGLVPPAVHAIIKERRLYG